MARALADIGVQVSAGNLRYARRRKSGAVALRKDRPSQLTPSKLRLLLLLFGYAWVGSSCFSAPFARGAEENLRLDLRPIFPGTQWCGPGDRARNPDDLGLFRATDSCCREHDGCPDSINAKSSNHELTNYAPYTKSHCDCDDKFYKCLKKVIKETNSPIALQVGMAYFNVVGPRCFKEEYPIERCIEYHKWVFPRRCKTYQLDKTLPKKYQWFDNKRF